MKKQVFNFIKTVVNSNKLTKKAARRTKKFLLAVIKDNTHQEVYNLSSFYPTINEYYFQQKDYSKTDPLISILLPTYNTPEDYLRECIDSIIVQSYQNWELCIADDNSPDENVVRIIREYQKNEKRIRLVQRKENGHISEATNSALDMAKGSFVALMDHDDILWPNALYEMVQAIRNNDTADLIYSDEDKIDGTGEIHSYPFLKPDFSPEFLESCNYITHFSCIRTSVMRKIQGFRKGYEGAQDWDLFIRIGEITDKIVHIPKILYSWRIHEGSTASDTDAKPYVYEAQRKLLEDHIARQKKTGEVRTGIIRQHRTVLYGLQPDSLLTVIIRNDSPEAIKKILTSLTKLDSGATYEVIVLTTSAISPSQKDGLSQIADVKFITGTEKDLKKKYIGTSLLFITQPGEIIRDEWAHVALSDTQIANAGIVYPVLLGKDHATVLSAGIGIGYGEKGVADMLEGMPFDDPHYTRGLYAKSRRNVTAGSNAMFALNSNIFETYYIPHYEQKKHIELAQELINKGMRNIYTPYLQFSVDFAPPIDLGGVSEVSKEDVYLNPHFSKLNGRMEVDS